MFGNTISPPSISAVQELKDLIDLISDPKKSSALLSQLQDALAANNDAINLQSDNLSEIDKSMKLLSDKEAELKSHEDFLAEKSKKIDELETSFDAREVAVTLSEIELKKKLDAFADEKAKFDFDSSATKSELEKAQAEADESKRISVSLIAEYNEKIAKFKSLIGG